MPKTPVWLQKSVNKSYVDLRGLVPTPSLTNVLWDGGVCEKLAKTTIIPHFKMYLTWSFFQGQTWILKNWFGGHLMMVSIYKWVYGPMRLAVPFWHCPLLSLQLAVANGSWKSGWKYKRARGQVEDFPPSAWSALTYSPPRPPNPHFRSTENHVPCYLFW